MLCCLKELCFVEGVEDFVLYLNSMAIGLKGGPHGIQVMSIEAWIVLCPDMVSQWWNIEGLE